MAADQTLDGTAPVRPGEALDLERLRPYLESVLGTPLGDLRVEQFPAGHSNLTYLVRASGRELVLRRPPFGSQVKTAHDMGREVRILSRLSPVWPRAPRPLAYCQDADVLGAPFYLMERIRGLILRKELPPGLLLDPPAVGRLCESLVDTLVELHGLDAGAIGLGDLGRPEGYLERQVSGWTRRYQDARTDDIPAMAALASWLAESRPPSGPPALIHNDFKHDNVVLDPEDPTRIKGVLDWEMATLGDPLCDLGTALCYWVEPEDSPALRELRFGPTTLPGSFTRRQLCERYAARSGRDVSGILYYYAFGLFKTAVVVQQIYVRYRRGLTADERFARLGEGVRVLAAQAALSLQQGRI